MSDRQKIIADAIAQTQWASWRARPIAGDASARRYLRLTNGTDTAIVMDADPALGLETQRFADIAQWLQKNGLSAPQVHMHDPKIGLMVIEDLGTRDIADWIRSDPVTAPHLYKSATDVLITLDSLKPPTTLEALTPKVAGEMLAITGEWYAHESTAALAQSMEAHFKALCGPAKHVALRDYHAENLIWRPERSGLARVGLLDFQDAVVAPRGYDLISLTRDVRRKVEPDVAGAVTQQFATGVAQPHETLLPALACLAVQRNLRILGVFARLAKRDGKQRYMTMIPHLWDMITEDLKHPALIELQTCVRATLPPPTQSAIKDLL